jgi:hypothetical protein
VRHRSTGQLTAKGAEMLGPRRTLNLVRHFLVLGGVA